MWVLDLAPTKTLTFEGGAKWVSKVLDRECEGKEVLTKKVAMDAIEAGHQGSVFSRFFWICDS